MIKIATIDDDSSYLKLIAAMLKLEPAYQLLLQAPSVEHFWKSLPERAMLDIIFIDIELPGMSGISALPQFRKRFPQADLIMLTRFEAPDLLIKSITRGADGYLLKGFPMHEFTSYLRILKNGGSLISPKMAKYLIQHISPYNRSKAQVNLTEKEVMVLELFSAGKSYKDVANMLEITVDGVRYHVRQIYAKLGVDKKIDAIRSYQGISELQL